MPDTGTFRPEQQQGRDEYTAGHAMGATALLAQDIIWHEETMDRVMSSLLSTMDEDEAKNKKQEVTWAQDEWKKAVLERIHNYPL